MLPLLSLLLALPALAQDPRPPAVIEAEISGHLSAARESLADIESLIEAAHTRAVQQQIRRKVVRAEDHLNRVALLTSELSQYSRAPMPPPLIIEEEPPPPFICPPGDFQRIVAAIQGESFANEQLRVLQDASRDRWFTVDQIKGLVNLFTFGDDKVNAAAMLHGHAADPENWYLIYEAFTFDSDKKKLQQRVGQ